ncbi:sensor histidine kinase [Geminicoccus harenae]|uniref:sensor histidine kinase n=2 Tax=Geminicoccus harenae TaxID=2498453 RepID=UPI001C93A2AC|nr:sensor histidine kinase [Geminicoccus harenae]
MIARSLKLRLILGSAVWILVALLTAGLALQWFFRDLAERRLEEELVRHLDQITGRLAITLDGAARLEAPLSDPRFATPFSGLYYVVIGPDGRAVRSRSLWDSELDLPKEPPAGADGIASYELMADGAGPVRVVERQVRAYDVAGEARIAVAASIGPLVADVASFTRFLVTSLAMLGLLLLLAAFLAVRLGLLPLDRLGLEVARIRKREAERLGADVPSELAPLVDELNGLLADNRAMVERARHDAADLAHGLKTPLTILNHEAELLAVGGDPELGQRLQVQVERMRRRIDQRLARARAQARLRSGEVVAVAPVVTGLAQVVRPLLERRGLRLELDLAPGLRFGGAREDLEEMLGNLLENAAKWAGQRILVTGRLIEGRLVLGVADDGPGLPDADRTRALARGGRLDQQTPGDGLGLAIVGDLVELHRGRMTLDRARLGGLQVTLTLPAGGE